MKTIQTPDRTLAAAPTMAGYEQEVQRPQLPALEEQRQAALRGHRLESLPLGASDDHYEQEADQTAAQVVERLGSGSEPSGSIQATPTPGPAVQTKGDGNGGSGSAAALTQLPSAPGSGRPIEPAIRAPLERAMGASLSDVRLHTDQPAQQLNESLNARATTVGRDIHFAKGEFEPLSVAGRELLAHELTHVLQQRRGGHRLQRVRKDDKGKNKAPGVRRPPLIPPDPGDSPERQRRMEAGPPGISPPAPGVKDALQRRRATAGNQYDSTSSPLDGGQAAGQGAVSASATAPLGQYDSANSPLDSGSAAAGQGAVSASATADLEYSNFGPEAARAAGQGAGPASAQRPNNAQPKRSRFPNYAGDETMRRWRAEGARRARQDELRKRQ